ncbi:MAG: flotillin family protein [Planctomycetaceae bacterium]
MTTAELLMYGGIVLVFLVGFAVLFSRFYRKPGPEEAIVKTGVGGLKVCTGHGMVVVPLIQEAQTMDLSVKRIEIAREGADGLICQDNIRADIKVAFYVRVNNEEESIKQVAEMLNPQRASEITQLRELFEAKFSEALKTVGKQFDFVSLYTDRDNFRDKIVTEIGTDLNGYRLDNCHIDYLEQTPLELLSPQNILDAEGIKKITELTAKEKVQENHFTREKEKTIKKQDVEAAETIYELERQRVEAQEKQKREIAAITAREEAEAEKIRQEERLRSESARIVTEEEVQVAEENKNRQIIVAAKNKQRTDAVETERVEKDRLLEVTDRERVVGLAEIEKEKVIEAEKRNVQEIIRERVVVERTVVEEEQRIKDTEQFATADRTKRVAVTLAEKEAEEALVKDVKKAEAAKNAAEFGAKQVVIEADARRESAEKDTAARKMLAEAKTADAAAVGLAEAQVTTAKAEAFETHGTAEASVLEKKAVAEAKGKEAIAVAVEKEGTAEATVMHLKYSSEAKGIEEKAEAMKLFDGVGREHEEFKLSLNKEKDIEIAAITAQEEIAEAQSRIVGEALKSARIDIVGGETVFFDKIVDSIKGGKAVDRFVHNSETLTDVKNSFFNGNPDYFKEKLQGFIDQFGMSFEDVKDLSVSALIGKMLVESNDDESKADLNRILDFVKSTGSAGKKVKALGLGLLENTK